VSPKQRASLAGLQPAPSAVPPLPARPAAPLPAEVQTPVQQTSEVQTPEVAKPEGRRRRQQGQPAVPAARPQAEAPGLPKYLRLERKELLIWPDQITRLSILARVLNRNRRGAGERITQNTLIRVAVALLLSRSQDLAGTTEEELRRSLGLPDLQSPEVRSCRELVGVPVNNRAVSAATASSFLSCPGVRCGTGWLSARPERVIGQHDASANGISGVSRSSCSRCRRLVLRWLRGSWPGQAESRPWPRWPRLPGEVYPADYCCGVVEGAREVFRS
jgi:hypothetical protein